MERLTKRDKEIPIPIPTSSSKDFIFWTKIYEKLEQYEDAEEQGRLVVLPCKVGDIVYYIDGGKSYKAKASTFRFNNSGVRVYCERNFMGYIGFEGIYGKTVFLTIEEAEKALEAKK